MLLVSIKIFNLRQRNIPPKLLVVKIFKTHTQKFLKDQNSLRLKFPQKMLIETISSSFFLLICGKSNHSAQKCWYQYNFSHTEDEGPQTLAVMNINEVPDPNWYADTGTTAYMTNDLTSCPSYKGNEKIFVGDGLSI